MAPVTIPRDSAAMRISPNGGFMKHRKTISSQDSGLEATKGLTTCYFARVCSRPCSLCRYGSQKSSWSPKSSPMWESACTSICQGGRVQGAKACIRSLRRWVGTDCEWELSSYCAINIPDQTVLNELAIHPFMFAFAE